MALVLKDRVKETSTTTGTGTFTLAGAATGFQSFSVIGNGNTTFYCIVDSSSGAWEVGIGTYSTSGTTLSRDTILESSNSGSAVNFGAGSKDVFVTYPAEKAVYTENSGSFPSGTTMLFVQTSAPTGWTKSTSHDNKALRVVSGTAGSGGSVAFTTAFTSQGVGGSISSTTATNIAATQSGTVGSTTLAESQIPSHYHTQPVRNGSASSGTSNVTWSVSNAQNNVLTSNSTGGGGSHNHSFSGDSHNHTQDSHSHTFSGTSINLAVQYVDAIIAVKD